MTKDIKHTGNTATATPRDTKIVAPEVHVMPWHPSYTEDVHRLCFEFSQESLKDYGLTVTPDRLTEMIEVCKEISFFLIIDGKVVGLIAGFITHNMTNKKAYLQEVIWFVTKEHRAHGKLLMEAFQNEARAKGATGIVMVLMCNSMSDRLDKLYTRMGYKKIEVHYLKEFEHEVEKKENENV